ncbi:MAG: hypothetical protein K5662_03340 [Lachnospiraceae bacterium]|nr:hypothetical protein [Lachnospiraceae bacterium]
MLEIILLCLKIAGIVILAILGLLVLALVLILFVPFRYRISVRYDNRNGILGNGLVTFLLRMIRAEASYGEKFIIKVKCLFFTIYPREKKKRTGKDKVKPAKKDRPKASDEAKDKGIASAKDKISDNDKSMDPDKDKISDNDKSMDPAKESESAENKPANKAKGDSKGFLSKFNIDMLKEYYELLTEDSTKDAFECCKIQFFKIIKSIKPGTFNASVVVGLDDEYNYGRAMAFSNILYTYLNENVIILPNFGDKDMDINVFIKGKIRMISLVTAGLRILLNKNCRLFVKKFKRVREKYE